MIAGFPSRIPIIEGPITLKELIRVFQHMIECAQSTVTAYHVLNFTVLVVPRTIWGLYSNEQYPDPPRQPSTNPPYADFGNPIQNQMIKDEWAMHKKYYEEDQNMNMALNERFLAHLPSEHQRGYREVMIRDPNRRFEATFLHFYTESGQEDEVEIEENKENMKKEWSTRDGFQMLKTRIMDGITYAMLAGKPINDDDALNMLIVVVARTGLFANAYQEWHILPPVQKNAFERIHVVERKGTSDLAVRQARWQHGTRTGVRNGSEHRRQRRRRQNHRRLRPVNAALRPEHSTATTASTTTSFN